MPWPAFNFPSGGLSLETVNANTQMEVGKRYNIDSAMSVDMTLPLAADSPSNSMIEIISEADVGGFVVNLNANQFIHLLGDTTTPTTGTITLDASGGVLKGSITLICIDDNGLEWVAYPAGGNYTVA